MAANVGLQYAAELLPTPIRTQGVSLIHIFGIIAHSLAPYVIDTVNRILRFVRWRFAHPSHRATAATLERSLLFQAKIWQGLPMMLIGVASLLAATVVLFLPETLGRDLPQTLRQGEEFGKDQSFWTLPCCDRSRSSNRRRRYRPSEI